jgi:two-component system response regulator RegA|tara:strand:- start:882 stop:1433 length:552 start_codon:yes stop_codon:yes gene_type:complete
MNKEQKKILLVEDDDVFSRVISRALVNRGYELFHAAEVDSAIVLIETDALDYAILDLNLGGHTSLKLIPVLKGRNPMIRILILTGYASIATAVEAIKLGADNYLAKPANADEIVSALVEKPAGEAPSYDSNLAMESMSVRRLEWEHIQKILMENDGNISATARQLRMHRRTLQRKLQKRPVAK